MTFKLKRITFYSLLMLSHIIFASCDRSDIASQVDENPDAKPPAIQPVISTLMVQTTPSPTATLSVSPTPKAVLIPSPTPELEALFIYNQGVRAFRVEEYNDAITSFNMVIKRLPEIALGYKARGGAYYGLEKYDRAIEDLEKAIEIDPDIGGAYLYLGLIYLAQDNKPQAKIELQKAITLIHPVREKWEYQQAEKALYNLNQ